MSKLLVIGCSASSGYGFNPNNPSSDCYEAPDLWVNLLHRNIENLQHYEMTNLSKAGFSNAEIFESAVNAIADVVSDDTSELWCQWTSLHRLRFDAGFELYPTSVSVAGSIVTTQKEIRTNQFVLTENFLKNFFNEYRSIMHPHREICQILRYVMIINKMCYEKNIKVRHINGLCPWDANYFSKLIGPNIKPNNYTNYTKEKILFVDNRNDNEIFELYNKLHNDYQPLISNQIHTWLNLNTSLYSQKIPKDYNYDGMHPGVESNRIFFELLKPLLTT